MFFVVFRLCRNFYFEVASCFVAVEISGCYSTTSNIISAARNFFSRTRQPIFRYPYPVKCYLNAIHWCPIGPNIYKHIHKYLFIYVTFTEKVTYHFSIQSTSANSNADGTTCFVRINASYSRQSHGQGDWEFCSK